MVYNMSLLLHGGLFLASCSVILTRCALAPSLFALHPATNALAFHVCFPVGIFVMIERKGTSDHTQRVALAKAHAGLQSLALVLIGVDGVAAFATKEAFGKPHLTSPHSRIAAATIALSLLSTFGGLTTTFFGGKKANWQWKNPGHRIGCTLAFVLGGTTAVLGVYSSSWDASQLGPALQWLIAASTGVGYAWVLVCALTVKPPAAKPKHN